MGELPALPVVADDVADAALHGSFCPKMCNFACPVTAATGRDDALPWSFHRTVSDLARSRAPLDDHTATHLEACSGCLACQVPCLFDQDVPSQVRAGRAAGYAAGHAVAGARDAVTAVAEGASPFGGAIPGGDDGAALADVVVVPGCRDGAREVAALVRLLERAGRTIAVVAPDGCCGATLTDLGATEAAAAAMGNVGERLAEVSRIVAMDPHCLPALRDAAGADAAVEDVTTALDGLLAEGAITLAGAPTAVTYHDPCLLARGEGVTAPARRLLAAAGAEVVEPEGAGAHTVCSGGGMALELVAPRDAAATAAHRARSLTATGVPVVTACAGARRRLADAGVDVTDLVTFLVDRLPEPPT